MTGRMIKAKACMWCIVILSCILVTACHQETRDVAQSSDRDETIGRKANHDHAHREQAANQRIKHSSQAEQKVGSQAGKKAGSQAEHNSGAQKHEKSLAAKHNKRQDRNILAFKAVPNVACSDQERLKKFNKSDKTRRECEEACRQEPTCEFYEMTCGLECVLSANCTNFVRSACHSYIEHITSVDQTVPNHIDRNDVDWNRVTLLPMVMVVSLVAIILWALVMERFVYGLSSALSSSDAPLRTASSRMDWLGLDTGTGAKDVPTSSHFCRAFFFGSLTLFLGWLLFLSFQPLVQQGDHERGFCGLVREDKTPLHFQDLLFRPKNFFMNNGTLHSGLEAMPLECWKILEGGSVSEGRMECLEWCETNISIFPRPLCSLLSVFGPMYRTCIKARTWGFVHRAFSAVPFVCTWMATWGISIFLGGLSLFVAWKNSIDNETKEAEGDRPLENECKKDGPYYDKLQPYDDKLQALAFVIFNGSLGTVIVRCRLFCGNLMRGASKEKNTPETTAETDEDCPPRNECEKDGPYFWQLPTNDHEVARMQLFKDAFLKLIDPVLDVSCMLSFLFTGQTFYFVGMFIAVYAPNSHDPLQSRGAELFFSSRQRGYAVRGCYVINKREGSYEGVFSLFVALHALMQAVYIGTWEWSGYLAVALSALSSLFFSLPSAAMSHHLLVQEENKGLDLNDFYAVAKERSGLGLRKWMPSLDCFSLGVAVAVTFQSNWLLIGLYLIGVGIGMAWLIFGYMIYQQKYKEFSIQGFAGFCLTFIFWFTSPTRLSAYPVVEEALYSGKAPPHQCILRGCACLDPGVFYFHRISTLVIFWVWTAVCYSGNILNGSQHATTGTNSVAALVIFGWVALLLQAVMFLRDDFSMPHSNQGMSERAETGEELLTEGAHPE